MKMKTNRVISLCLILALALAVVPLLVSAAKTPLRPGDLNQDGVVHSDDARIALRAAARIIPLTDIILANGDIDGNGKITSADARRILRAAAKIEALPGGSDNGEARTTAEPVTAEPVTAEPVTAEPVTAEPVTAEPVTEEPVTAEPVTAEPVTAEPVTAEPVTAESVTAEPVTEEPAATVYPATDFRTVYGGFAAKLLKAQYARDNTGETRKNVMISPLSVITALAMAENGAKGNTLRQLEDLFGANVEDLNKMLSEYVKNLPQAEKSKLVAANSVWIRDGAFESVAKRFLENNKAFYNAEVREEPFNEKTLADVNGWCDKNTDGMIKKIIEQIDPADVMYLINALTFDAEWARPFEKGEVSKREFTNADGTKTEVEMMYGEESGLIDADAVEGFVKPYFGNKYSFVALLPKEGSTVDSLIALLDADTVSGLLGGVTTAHLRVGLPKFESEYSCEMSETLKTLGVTDAFDGVKADFGGIGRLKSGNNVYVSDVIHKTFISVDEQGTRAAAVTAIVARANAVMQMRYIILDRPFVYMIVDNATNLPIFIGVMNQMK
ncbi:MAG: hypothetical protein IJK23_02645 [Clostridia bacterium]|nr:hypothetical protein [Clostridia bacterium]